MTPPASTNSLCPYMDGSRFVCAKLAIRSRLANATGFGPGTINACARCFVTAERHDDRDRLSLSFDRRNRYICGRHNHVHLEAHQLTRELRNSFGSGLAVANLQNESFPFDIAKLPHPLPERLDIMRCSRWSARKKVADLRDLLWLLRLDQLTEAGIKAASIETMIFLFIGFSAFYCNQNPLTRDRCFMDGIPIHQLVGLE